MRVIIIEDNKFKYDCVNFFLEDEFDDLEIDWYKNVTTGLEALSNSTKDDQSKYDVAILDNYLPLDEAKSDSGPYAARLTKKIKELGLDDLPIIINTTDKIKANDYEYLSSIDNVRIMPTNTGFDAVKMIEYIKELLNLNIKKLSKKQ